MALLRTSAVLRTLLLLAAASVWAPARADTRLGDGCDLAILGASDKAGFMRFDSALNAAIQAQDAAALAPLVEFPLRVNQAGGGHVWIDNAAALQAHFAQVFTPAVRAAVTRQKPDALFCKADGGVMYGDGEVWADRVDAAGGAAHFRVTAVNVPAGAAASAMAKAPPAAAAKPLLACSTDKVRVVIDGGDGKAPRYRAWNKPHAPPDAPALALVGKADSEGSGSCLHRIWRFRSGNVDYVLSEPGCGPDTPQGAQAQLEVLIGGQSRMRAWCF